MSPTKFKYAIEAKTVNLADMWGGCMLLIPSLEMWKQEEFKIMATYKVWSCIGMWDPVQVFIKPTWDALSLNYRENKLTKSKHNKLWKNWLDSLSYLKWKLSIFVSVFIVCVYSFVYVCICSCHNMCVEVRELTGVSSLLPPYGSWG